MWVQMRNTACGVCPVPVGWSQCGSQCREDFPSGCCPLPLPFPFRFPFPSLSFSLPFRSLPLSFPSLPLSCPVPSPFSPLPFHQSWAAVSSRAQTMPTTMHQAAHLHRLLQAEQTSLIASHAACYLDACMEGIPQPLQYGRHPLRSLTKRVQNHLYMQVRRATALCQAP